MQTLQSVKAVSDQLWVGGQPSLDEFSELQKIGIRHVINLRPDMEMQGFDEGSYVELLGMTYSQLPIIGMDDLTPQAAEQLDEQLNAAEGPVLVHCASGNRVGALFALHAFFVICLDAETALQIGRDHGLTKLEPMVQALFQSIPV
jgi:uncharacterized protein (TIGR01244 family)